MSRYCPPPLLQNTMQPEHRKALYLQQIRKRAARKRLLFFWLCLTLLLFVTALALYAILLSLPEGQTAKKIQLPFSFSLDNSFWQTVFYSPFLFFCTLLPKE